jgi:adenine deaminase
VVEVMSKCYTLAGGGRLHAPRSHFSIDRVNDLELLQEAGFHPLEVIQSATMNGALTLYEPMHKAPEIGVVREGMLADMVIVDQNPLQNFKVLYANGTVRLNDRTGKVERVGGIKWTIKDGIAYDAKKLAADVAATVEKQKRDHAGKRRLRVKLRIRNSEFGIHDSELSIVN